MQIVLAESCFPNVPHDEAIRLVSEAGAVGMELIVADPRGAAELADAKRLAAIAAAAKDVSVAIPSICLATNCLTDGLVRQSDATDRAVEDVRTAMRGVAELGTAVLALPFYQKAEIVSEADLEFLCRQLAGLAEEAELLGVTIGVESMLPVNQKRYLITHTGGGGVKVYYDVANCQLRKLDPATEIRDLGAEDICQIRLRDVRLRDSQPAEVDLDLGEGQVDLPAVCRSLHAVGYDRWVCLKSQGRQDPLETAKHNVAFARKLLWPGPTAPEQ